MRRLLGALGLCVALLGAATIPLTGDAPKSDAGPGGVLVVLGDSLSAGCCAGEDDIWPAILSQRLDASAANVAVNAATAESLITELRSWPSGRTQPQLDEALSLIAGASSVAAVTLGIGTNDQVLLEDPISGEPCAFEPSLACQAVGQEAVDAFTSNVHLILGTLRTAVGPDTPILVMPIYLEGGDQWLNSVIVSEASEHGGLLSDVAPYYDELDPALTLAPDVIHKIAAGHRVIADVFSNAMPPDSDGDGLSDLMESVLGSDPQLTDSDGDGCSDGVEFGPREEEGGRRLPTTFWDFYDVWSHPSSDPTIWERNLVVSIADILAVSARFGPAPEGGPSNTAAFTEALIEPVDNTSYHAGYDRGIVVGANDWDRAPPDGFITITEDILGVAAQFGHSCA